jgi:hypothetical protein
VRRRNRLRALAVVVVASCACGSDRVPVVPVGPPIEATPDPCLVAPEFRNSWSWEAPPRSGFGAPVTTSSGGVVRAIADWSSVSNNVDLYLVDGTCSAFPSDPGPPACPRIYAAAEEVATKPEVLAACVSGGSYLIILVNRGPGGDTGTFRYETPAR